MGNSGWVLLARARRTGVTVCVLVVLGICEYLLGSASLQLFGPSVTLSVPWAVLIPVVGAAAVGVTVRSAVADLEAVTSRSLPLLRAVPLTAALLVGLASTVLGSLGLTGQLTGPAAVRNFVGFVGLGLICAAAVGSNLSWLLPVALAIASASVGASAGVPRAWAWPIHDDGDPLAAGIAVGLLVVGLAVVIAWGSPERDPEPE